MTTDATSSPETLPDPEDDLPEQMRIRREKREQLASRGREPYAIGLPITSTIADVRAANPDLPPDTSTGTRVGLAGRVIYSRNTGKLCFATLRSGDGTEIQAMVSLAGVGEARLEEWKDLVDLANENWQLCQNGIETPGCPLNPNEPQSGKVAAAGAAPAHSGKNKKGGKKGKNDGGSGGATNGACPPEVRLRQPRFSKECVKCADYGLRASVSTYCMWPWQR